MRTNYLRAASIGTLLGLIVASTLTNEQDLLLLAKLGQTMSVVIAWIGGAR